MAEFVRVGNSDSFNVRVVPFTVSASLQEALADNKQKPEDQWSCKRSPET